MKIEYAKRYSNLLGRDMEYKVYGHTGKPILCVPCQGGRFFEFEDMKMLDVYAPYIERGDIQVFTIDTIDWETIANKGNPTWRIARHENWIRYIMEEALPEFSHISEQANGGYKHKFKVVGLSLGALHAATLFFRFPDSFDGLMGFSGIYSNEYYFGGYHDDLTYYNSPEQFLKNMPADHPFLEKYRQGKIILCVGQGAWEEDTLVSTRNMGEILHFKGVNAWVDVWGKDVKHDWDWWYVQAAYFLPKFIY
ncbi:MAG: esterase family protein [Clostridia bacterium]|nr:esterase family protein [Clostridia bacterium]